jgi:hypothetical protein
MRIASTSLSEPTDNLDVELQPRSISENPTVYVEILECCFELLTSLTWWDLEEFPCAKRMKRFDD